MQYLIQHKGEHGWLTVAGYQSKAAADAHATMLRRHLKQCEQAWRGCVRIVSHKR